MVDVDNVLYNVFGQWLIFIIYIQVNQYCVVLEYNIENILGFVVLDIICLISSDGGVVLLSLIVKIEQCFVLFFINYLDQFLVMIIFFNVLDNYLLGDVVQVIMDIEKMLNLLVDIIMQFQGSIFVFQLVLGSIVWLIVVVVVVMYIVFGILYESFIYLIIIFLMLFIVGVGVLLVLLIVGSELDVIVIIGIILLIGIVKKNVIMMIDFVLVVECE